MERFRTQKSTHASLDYQQTSAETDVREMGKMKEDLERDLADVRYIGQDDSGDMREKINQMELVMKENSERKSKFLEQIVYITRKQENIRRCFYGLVSLLTGLDVTNKPLHSMLDICFKEVRKLIEKIGEGRVDLLMEQMEEDGYKIETEDGDVIKVEEEQRRKRKEEAESAEAVEDEEVPTRASLRRQADVMINARDRGRGNMIKKK